MKNGFTLVELSIVLVIIGLLIGGILVGQSLINAAKVNALVKQVSQYDIAVIQFKSKYKSIPGDSRRMPNPGDGDGIMEDTKLEAWVSGLYYADYFNSEISNFWYHLSITGFQPEKIIYNNNASGGIYTTYNIPKASMGKGAIGAAGFMPYTNGDGNSYYFLADFGKTTTTQFNTNVALFSYAYTPLEAMSIDKKLDDGIVYNASRPDTGIVHSWHPTDGAGTDCYAADGVNYLVTHPNKECFLYIKIASNTGDMKTPIRY